MGTKKSFINSHSDPKLIRTNRTIQWIILLFFCIVMYDSYQFDLPFHYILFAILGQFIGRVFKVSHTVTYNHAEEQLTLKKNRWSIVFMVILLAFRFMIGPYVLDLLHFLYITDALLLFSIGIYIAKWRVLVKQIDELAFQMLENSTNKKDD